MILGLIQKAAKVFMPKVVVKRNYNNKITKFIFLVIFSLVGDGIDK